MSLDNSNDDAEKFDIEVVDDTPEQDRGRKPAAEPVTIPDENEDDELSQYSEKVQTRFRKLSRGYHDERRSKEAAQRERDEALTYAQQVTARTKELERQLAEGSKVFIETSQSEASFALEAAKREYKEAFENGDADKATAAQEKMARAVLAATRAKDMKPLTVSDDKDYSPAQNTQQQLKTSEEDERWLSENRWFDVGSSEFDPVMNGAAHGLHNELARQGQVVLGSKQYYEQIDARMHKMFPEYFGTESQNDRSDDRARRTVVAPATRSSSPKKVRLTATAVALAKKLGIPLEEYAKYARLEAEKGAK